jgi:hypothetical protein
MQLSTTEKMIRVVVETLHNYKQNRDYADWILKVTNCCCCYRCKDCLLELFSLSIGRLLSLLLASTKALRVMFRTSMQKIDNLLIIYLQYSYLFLNSHRKVNKF